MRYIRTYGREVGDDVYSVVNGVEYQPIVEPDVGIILFEHPCPSEFHGYMDVEIFGNVFLHPNDSYGMYPIMNTTERLKVRQIDWVEWLQPSGSWGYHNGIQYKHAVMNGPNIFDGDTEIFYYEHPVPLVYKDRIGNLNRSEMQNA